MKDFLYWVGEHPVLTVILFALFAELVIRVVALLVGADHVFYATQR